jgi:transposase-like protein
MADKQGREYPPETVWNAQELYCVARLTYEQLAEETGVGISTLKRWGKTYEWSDKREELAKANADRAINLVLARSGMVESLKKTKDPQAAFAVAALEKLAMESAKVEEAARLSRMATEIPSLEINSNEDAVDVLEGILRAKLAIIYADPMSADMSALKDVQKGLVMLSELRPQKGKKKPTGGISADLEKQIREIL